MLGSITILISFIFSFVKNPHDFAEEFCSPQSKDETCAAGAWLLPAEQRGEKIWTKSQATDTWFITVLMVLI